MQKPRFERCYAMPLNEGNILDWYFMPSHMKSFGERIFSDTTKHTLSVSKKILMELSDESPGGNKLPESRKIDEIYWKFQNNNDKSIPELVDLFTRREIRVFIWALDYLSPRSSKIILFSSNLGLAMELIQARWKDSFMESLWHILARNWEELQRHTANFNLLTDIVKKNSQNYTGTRTDIRKTIHNLRYFENSVAPSNFAKDLIRQGIHFNSANNLIGQRESVLTYSYFSVALKRYLDELRNRSSLDDQLLHAVYKFLDVHKKYSTTLVACAGIINSQHSHRFQELIKFETIRLISDPNRKQLWQSSDLDVFETEDVEKARTKLNSWINKVFIETFFEKLVQDERRKIYWLRFIEKIDNVVFCGNRSNYHFLRNIQKISQQVDARYKITDRNQSTCAIVIYSKSFVFVEFTDVGALYIYRRSSFNVNLNSLSGIEDLKLWSSDKFACKTNGRNFYNDYYTTSHEGRITHQGDWESRVNYWMSRYYD